MSQVLGRWPQSYSTVVARPSQNSQAQISAVGARDLLVSALIVVARPEVRLAHTRVALVTVSL